MKGSSLRWSKNLAKALGSRVGRDEGLMKVLGGLIEAAGSSISAHKAPESAREGAAGVVSDWATESLIQEEGTWEEEEEGNGEEIMGEEDVRMRGWAHLLQICLHKDIWRPADSGVHQEAYNSVYTKVSRKF